MIKKLFFDRGFWRSAMTLGLPVALQNLLMSSLSLIDTLMISQLGDVPLSSVGMAGQLSWMMQLALFGLMSGSSIFFSQFWGIKDIKGIRRIYGVLITFAMSVSAVFVLVGALFPETVISVFNKDPDVIKTGASYLRIAVYSYPAVALTGIFSSLLRSTECVRLPMWSSFVSSVMNAVLNWVLIYGRFGFEPMEVQGAATATVISAWSGAVVCFVISIIKKNLVISPVKEVFSYTKEDLARFFRVSTPVIINESMWGLGTVCYNIVFSRMGYEYYAAVSIFRTMDGIMFTFFVGLCNACCVMVGKDIGAGRIEEAKLTAKRYSFIVPALSFLTGIAVLILRNPVVSLFSLTDSLSETVRESASVIIGIYGFEYVLRNIPYIQIVGIFRPAGDSVIGMKLDLLCVWAVALPLTVIAAFLIKLPFPAVFAVMIFAEDFAKVPLCLRRYRSGKWIRPITEEGKAGLSATEN
ncbi:MAG: MATE family efflux transporter [Clostridia bacterium]|nr:MATE family efflux transporter [Clostridia bacterium]